MATIDEQDLINRLTLRGQITLAVSVAGLLVMLSVGAMKHSPGASGDLRGQGAVPGQAAGANAGHPQPPAHQGDILDWLVVAAAAVWLPLSVVLPRWITTQNRRRIATGTWLASLKPQSQPQTDTLFTRESLQSDRGKLAYVCWMQLSLGGFLLFPALAFAAFIYISTKSPIALAMGVLLGCGLVAWFPTRARVANWIDRQEESLIQERQLAVSKPPGTRFGQGLQESRNRPRRDDGSSGVEDEVCGWLTEGAGAKDLDRPRELPDHDRQAAGPRRQPSGAGRIANSTSDAAAPPVEPAASLVSTLKDVFAPAPGIYPWKKVRVSLAFALIVNLVTGVLVGSKLYEADPRMAGWGGWLFLAPFILFGVALLTAFVGRLIVATKYTWDEKSARSRRTRRSRGSQVSN